MTTQNVPRVTGGAPNEGKRPFATLGEQLRAIAAAYSPPGAFPGAGQDDPRLYAATSGASAGVGSDGGLLIQKDFAVDLMTGALQAGVLASRADEQPLGAGSDTLEVAYFEETSRGNGSRFGGVQVFRHAEAEAVTAKRPKLGKWEGKVEDMTGLAYLTERQAQDNADALGRVFDTAFREEMSWTLDDEIYSGNGVGRCLGVLNSGALIRVPKETGQLAGTIVAENLAKAWARVQGGSRRRGIWVYAPEVEPQLSELAVGTGATNVVKYASPGEVDAEYYMTIYGRPALPLEQAPASGQVGDVAFLDLTRYALVRKGAADRVESIHVRYLWNERVWKWTTRVNGAPKIRAPLIPARGSSTNTVSPFVALEARAA